MQRNTFFAIAGIFKLNLKPQQSATSMQKLAIHTQICKPPDFKPVQGIILCGNETIIDILYGNQSYHTSDYKKVDLKNSFAYPGFIDSHSHFTGLGQVLSQADLSKCQSVDEILEVVQKHSEQTEDLWLRGFGWDETKWKQQPAKLIDILSDAFPDRPVYLKRRDFHAALINNAAADISGIKAGLKIKGGKVETINAKLSGLLIDKAMTIVEKKIKSLSQVESYWEKASNKCLRYGLTSVSDAGLHFDTIKSLINFQKEGNLKLNLYAMCMPDSGNLAYFKDKAPYQSGTLHIRSWKYFADGAFGSRGANLRKAYYDKPGHYGLMTAENAYLKEEAKRIKASGWQMICHAIGDKALENVLDCYESAGHQAKDRWRIEHVQLAEKNDIERMAKYNIIPSMQPIQAVSDALWIDKRLGVERAKTAYAHQQILNACPSLIINTDFPIESPDPVNNFCAAVFGKNRSGDEKMRFGEKLSAKDALAAMTIKAAEAQFEENEKGNLERGKLADISILDTNLLSKNFETVAKSRVKATICRGKLLWEAPFNS